MFKRLYTVISANRSAIGLVASIFAKFQFAQVFRWFETMLEIKLSVENWSTKYVSKNVMTIVKKCCLWLFVCCVGMMGVFSLVVFEHTVPNENVTTDNQKSFWTYIQNIRNV